MKKIKQLTKEQIIISLDRLTRFKNTETKYLRVFKDIILHNLIEPKYKKSELDIMEYEKLRDLAVEIFNFSLGNPNDTTINKKLAEYEKKVYKISPETEKLIQNNINYQKLIGYIEKEKSKNLNWLKRLDISKNITLDRQKMSLLYPIDLVIVAEGATEEILLPKFGQICGLDFDKEGIYIISAGGKNQVVKLYYELVETLNLPIFVLLDKDGFENSLEISAKLRQIDRVHILESGEFEDLLPQDLIKRTLEYEFKNISISADYLNNANIRRVEFLREVYKNRGMHDFKKVEFAQMVKKNIVGISDTTNEIIEIIKEIKELKNRS